MMRWKVGLLGMVLILSNSATGCKQQLFLEPGDYQSALKIGLPKDAETDPNLIVPDLPKEQKPPPTVLDPDRPIRFLTLPECFSLALEQGTVGFTQTRAGQSAGGGYSDTLVSSGGAAVGGDDSIRLFALDPAIIGTNIERALSKFDARWTTSVTWQKSDDAVLNVFQNLNNGDRFNLNSGLFKPLPTGGVAGITFQMDYSRLTQAPTQNFQVVNPAYRPRLQASFEQPLLAGNGVFINQLLAAHPGSVQTQLRPSGGAGEGILITRIRYDQANAEFERIVNFQLLNVEAGYWNLYSAYFTLYSREAGMRQSFVAWKLNKKRVEAGALKQQDLDQTRAQFEQFRGQRIQALGAVLEAERQLRGLLGMPVDDGTRLVPADTPTLAPYVPDWNSSIQETLLMRPELILARQELKARQLDVLLQKNNTRPDLRFVSSYDVNAIGTQLDGSEASGNAIAGLANNKFNSWTLGFRLDMPLGFRDANAGLRISRLNLARSYQQLNSQEDKALRYLAQQYRQIFEFYEQIRALRAQREANASQVNLRNLEFEAGRGTLDVLLEAQRFFADALAAEYQAIANYQVALASYQFAKGTLMNYNNVAIAEGALPNVVLSRAIEHQEARSKALILRQRAVPQAEAELERLKLGVIQTHQSAVPDLPTLASDANAQPLDPLAPRSIAPPVPIIAPPTQMMPRNDIPMFPNGTPPMPNIPSLPPPNGSVLPKPMPMIRPM